MKKTIIIITSIVLLLSFIPAVSYARNSVDDGSKVYTNYLYYNNEGLQRTRQGYVIDHLKNFLYNNYDESGERIVPSKDMFGDVEDLIDSIPYTDSKFTTINLNCFGFDGTPVYTEEQINEYVRILEYIDTLPFVVSVHPGYKSIPYADNEKYPFEYRPEYEFKTGEIYVVLFKEFTEVSLPEGYFDDLIPDGIGSVKIETYNKNQIEKGNNPGIYCISFDCNDPAVTLKFARSLYEDPRVKAVSLNYIGVWELLDQEVPAAGDVDGDGKIMMKDLLLIRQLVAGAASDNGDVFVNGDVNGDGAVNMKDVLTLRKILAGSEE